MSSDAPEGTPLDCTEVSERCPVENTIYGYYPNLEANAFFVALFALCFVVNIIIGWRYKTWTYMVAMGLACACSAAGYGGRILLNDNPYDIGGFNLQICCLTLSPAFNSAAIYLMLKHVVRHFGREWSRIRPKYYTWGFIAADLGALVLQGAGGGIAATADDDIDMRDTGDALMMAGISWQVATLFVFGVMVTDFLFRRFLRSGKDVPLSAAAAATWNDRKFQVFAASLVVVYFAILVRCVYRIAEMAGGWQNPIMQDEGLFIGLDSTLVGLATVLQTFLHPGFCFKAFTEKEIVKGEKSVGSDESFTPV